MGVYRNFQYIINNIVHCNNLPFLHYFHHGREETLKGLRGSKSSGDIYEDRPFCSGFVRKNHLTIANSIGQNNQNKIIMIFSDRFRIPATSKMEPRVTMGTASRH